LLEGSLLCIAVTASVLKPVPRRLDELNAPRTRRMVIWFVLSVSVSASLIGLGCPPRHRGSGSLEITFLDVGQGDCAILRLPDGTTILVDAGAGPSSRPGSAFDPGERIVCESLLEMGLDHLDYVVATHGDFDHVGGFAAVTRHLTVGQALVARGRANHPMATAFLRAGVPVKEISAGDSLQLGGARLEVVWPLAGEAYGDNAGSLVLRVVLGKRAILLTGDIEGAAEVALSTSQADLSADVLKVPHHGSRGASSMSLLERVKPRWAVISAPRLSQYGHPHAEAVERLRYGGAQVLTTGFNGAVYVVTDGERLDVSWLSRR
jgi:competence protein ComEC